MKAAPLLLLLGLLLPAATLHADGSPPPRAGAPSQPQATAASAAKDAARKRAVTRLARDFSRAEAFEANPGGATTSHKPVNADAFSHSSANMSFERELNFKIGNALFRRVWVSAPSSTRSADGLGPLFNARACQHCHLKDGRGHPPAPDAPEESAVSMLLRLSIPPQTDAQRRALAEERINAIPDPVYGGQLQDVAIQGHSAEGRLGIAYAPLLVRFGDGTVVTLRRPSYTVDAPAFGPLHPALRISPRIAPPMIGLGLLEAVPEADILARADPDDRDGDGISGRPNRVWSRTQDRRMLGRFGWKAGAPTLADQAVAAFSNDMGLSTTLLPDGAGDCTTTQTLCREAPNGGDAEAGGVEVPDSLLELVVFYSRNLAVPARRRVDDPRVLAGKRVFYRSGCTACHTPKFVTARGAPAEQRWQLIWPYTDLLLHDMGEGLADGSPEGEAGGREWRTSPLWGLGLTREVSGHSYFLHDGRARSLLEAILWHGGEAQAARDRVLASPADARADLIAFLESL